MANIGELFNTGVLTPQSEIDEIPGIGNLYKSRFNDATLNVHTVQDLVSLYRHRSKTEVEVSLRTVLENASANTCMQVKNYPLLHVRDVNFRAYLSALRVLRWAKLHPAAFGILGSELKIPLFPRTTGHASKHCGCVDTVAACGLDTSCQWTAATGTCVPSGSAEVAFHGSGPYAGQERRQGAVVQPVRPGTMYTALVASSGPGIQSNSTWRIPTNAALPHSVVPRTRPIRIRNAVQRYSP